MLQELSIKNLALIEQLTLSFKPGFTSLTGETGAGKSILLDGLGLSLGERANASLVRHGTNRADVSADFEISNLPLVQAWLIENELDDDNQCLLRRTLTAEGRSKAYINSLPVSVSQLKALSQLLIDIHGQHEHQTLLRNEKQRALLDAYAQHNNLVTQVEQNFNHWRNLSQKLSALQEKQADKQSRLELLQFQLQEFEQVNPVEEEFSDLSSEQKTLSHANEIKQSAYLAYQAIESSNAITDGFNSAISELEKVSEYNPKLNTALEQLQSALIETQEIASDIQSVEREIELDPNRLQQLDSRLAKLFSLSKKYLVEPSELIQKQQTIVNEINELNASAESLEQLKIEQESTWLSYQQASQALRQSRKEAALNLAKDITKSIHSLGMAEGIFSVVLYPEEKPSKHGMDNIEFQISANKGQPQQAINKVASGGELSRISLAIQVACAQVTSLPCLIFDEVDVGIGGSIAEVVGQKMQQLGKHCQVLSITHLGQVAAYGEQQLNISKSTVEDNTITNVIELNQEQRIEEIARMVGGVNLTEQTRKHAEEFLTNAQKR